MQKNHNDKTNNDENQEDEKYEIKNETEKLDFNNPDYSFVPKARHQWRQQGPYLVCFSCELQHAIYIGMDKLMVGETEEGQPIFKKRSEFTQE